MKDEGSKDEDSDLDNFDLKEKHLPATSKGTLQELLLKAFCNDGKILNALDLPLCHECTVPSPFSTDTHAWHQTCGWLIFLTHEIFPVMDTCWALVGCCHMITFLHIDSDGFNTHGLFIKGGKLWIFYREHKDMPLFSHNVFFEKGFGLIILQTRLTTLWKLFTCPDVTLCRLFIIK